MHKLSLADRLRHLRQTKGISQENLASLTAMSLEQIERIEESSDATIKELIQISSYFEVDLNWFILGTDVDRTHNLDYLVLIDQDAAAGYLDRKDDPTFFSQLEYYRIPGFNKSGDHRIFLVQGDSMQPTLSESDYLVCSLVNTIEKLNDGDLAVFVTERGIVVKRVRFKHEKVILESDNPKFNDFELEQESISEIWRVEAKVTKLIENLKPNPHDNSEMAMALRDMKEQLDHFKSELNRISDELKNKQ